MKDNLPKKDNIDTEDKSGELSTKELERLLED